MDEKRKNQSIQLGDGRMLGFAEYGPSGGEPVFYLPAVIVRDMKADGLSKQPRKIRSDL